MGDLKRQRNVFGLDQAKFKTGATNGGFGTNPGSVKKGSALTPTGNNEVGLAGANDIIIGFVSEVNEKTGYVRYLFDYEIKDILTNGTIPPGSCLVGYSDTDRGKAKAAVPTFANDTTPTVAELKVAAEIATNARWLVRTSTAGSATVVP